MRNHDEKTRDMARSVLPSTRRRGARQDRALAHKAERSRLRSALQDLAGHDDPDDYEGELTWEARRQIAWMVEDRRAADKVAPLLRWATRTIERDAALRDARPTRSSSPTSQHCCPTGSSAAMPSST